MGGQKLRLVMNGISLIQNCRMQTEKITIKKRMITIRRCLL